jgi:hypothetical protein
MGAREFMKKMPSDALIERTVVAWARDGKQRANSKDALRWQSLAILCEASGLGKVTAETLRTDWAKWQTAREV